MKYFYTWLLLAVGLLAQAQKTENVFLIMTDGLRWQEVFGGADSVLLKDKAFTRNEKRLSQAFWNDSSEKRRQLLFPFFWSTIASQGQLYGNRWLGNKVNLRNPYWFSYPGYNEVLSGYDDDKINSNDKKNNENITVLEYLNNQPSFKGKVAAYATWDCFPYIINQARSQVPVNAGRDTVSGNLTSKENLLNDILQTVPSLASDRQDFITYYLANEYIHKNQPRVFFLSFDETDEFAHEAKYDEYLYAANTVDRYIGRLWQFCQSHPQYKDKTTFIITTDHGRGDKNKKQWTSHGQAIPDSYQTWIAVLGPDTPPLGEIKTNSILFHNQIAKTLAKLLGQNFTNGKPIGDAIPTVFAGNR
ncbi:alkaline phosphatase family protein [Spirosoma sp. SC4-14]|uniref:alkaline phosphatase family protein n=1 Tax=Spirosoma sp. SC4-14 TaxID=3128900 RepID=UPI0030CD4918